MKTEVSNESNKIAYRILEEKYNAILERIAALERSKNEEQMLHESNDVVNSIDMPTTESISTMVNYNL